jgi:hypothetical protein
MTSWSDHETPAGAGRDAARATPAGTTGEDPLAAWHKALAAHKAGQRRGRHRRAARQPGPGMIRRMPPDGGDAA